VYFSPLKCDVVHTFIDQFLINLSLELTAIHPTDEGKQTSSLTLDTPSLKAKFVIFCTIFRGELTPQDS
jgi:hypothetical protein